MPRLELTDEEFNALWMLVFKAVNFEEKRYIKNTDISKVLSALMKKLARNPQIFVAKTVEKT